MVNQEQLREILETANIGKVGGRRDDRGEMNPAHTSTVQTMSGEQLFELK